MELDDPTVAPKEADKGIENYRTALQHGRDENRPLVVISNHISALDPHAASGALWSCFRPVVKKDVLSIPLYGGVARTLGSIGVDRTKASGVVNTLRSYIADNGHDAIPLYLCPEASTTNGEGLLRFKRGTFLTDTEVLPVCLQYQPTLALDILQIIRFMSCVRPKYICATILPPMRRRHGEDYQAFADRVGRAMAAAMGIKYELERTYEEALLFYTALEHQYRHRTGKFAPGRADATKKNNKKKNK
ncbi:hypothetical protein PTSG_10323 [Salpingoeca rosetta]|uniref:Phospholipid/glycerol acyltransferase domain-containing protein n=1 Tax=Salpingoeca rosetta (strain ATCC 50818 / BSB-021) TaxID=946362 RepID=F2UQZ2_SALR5|nr:uncharacterized protein PTSG_10323 [Salpingoeca rosetta]EGD80047.1 hypothetical protein PTSG_10323 [Salpingoeca rosetta]|eukprot:XP_004988372.1 hypothetical protein PTSG_10323 [Salpingoeca rosetta]